MDVTPRRGRKSPIVLALMPVLDVEAAANASIQSLLAKGYKPGRALVVNGVRVTAPSTHRPLKMSIADSKSQLGVTSLSALSGQ